MFCDYIYAMLGGVVKVWHHIDATSEPRSMSSLDASGHVGCGDRQVSGESAGRRSSEWWAREGG